MSNNDVGMAVAIQVTHCQGPGRTGGVGRSSDKAGVRVCGTHAKTQKGDSKEERPLPQDFDGWATKGIADTMRFSRARIQNRHGATSCRIEERVPSSSGTP